MSQRIDLFGVMSTILGRYYKSFHDKLRPLYLDDNGIPLYVLGPPLGPQHHPVTISQYALGLYNRYIESGNCEDRRSFVSQADWFVRTATRRSDFVVWEYHFNLWKYNAKAPWVSAMAQGEALSVLLRAYQLTGRQTYAQIATQALGSFEHTIEQGGVCATDSRGNVYYEEVAARPAAHILNGFISALWGLEDYYRVFHDSRSKVLFDAGVKTLIDSLADFDNGYWTRYSLLYPNQVASVHYHRLHILQMENLYASTGLEVFHSLADRWQGYWRNTVCRARQLVTYHWWRTFYQIQRFRTYLSLS